MFKRHAQRLVFLHLGIKFGLGIPIKLVFATVDPEMHH